MFAIALKGLAGRKFRASLTALSVVLGVAMISGTYVLTDTMNAGFDTIFTQSYRNADVVISGKAAFTGGDVAVQPPTFPEEVLTKVRALPDVAYAAGAIQSDQVKLIGKDGKVVATGGAPTLGFSADPKDQRFNPTELTSGSWPSGPKQIAIDNGIAGKEGFSVGDEIGVQTTGAAQRFRIAGIVKFSGGTSIGGATFALFDPPTAARLFDKVGRLDAVRVQSKSGVPPAKLVSEIKPLLPRNTVVRNAAAQAAEDKKDVNGFISFLQYALLAFAGIALFVGSFVIANTLSITIAQRTREFATLRTIGASRRQVLWSVVLEAFVIGLAASVVGLFLGLGLAKLLNRLFVAIGIDLPQGSTVFATRTIVVSLLVGTLITLFASLRPARRATRVPPIAAVREGSVLPESRWAKYGPYTALAVLLAAVALVCVGSLAGGLATAPRLFALGGGVLLLFFGVSMNASKVVRPLSNILGWPAREIGGAPGILARDNAARNPARTASTASALMIGLALVTFVAIFGQGLRASFEGAVNELFIADYTLTSTNTFTPISATAGNALVGKPGASVVSAIRAGSARFLGSTHNLSGVEGNLPEVMNLTWVAGSDNVPAKLGKQGFFTDSDYAKAHHLSVGSSVSVQFPAGERVSLRMLGTYDKPQGGSPFGDAIISTALFDKHYPNPQDQMVLINTPDGVSDANTATLEDGVSGFADAKIATRDQFKKDFEGPINKLLNLLYVLLALSVVVSLFGIVNTLVLTVFERTRELGMLRAVGMTRRQVRMMIRYESIVTSLMGAALGIVVGTFLAVLIVHALSSQGIVFSFPLLQIVYFVLAAILVGILAAILPARRAARLNVLQALQYE
ncbi:MAG: FtsX-like permease family protein [Actinomycetota bacterium]|nr:FtsX-like permease family protein [Actinomycetota bacterium]